MTSPGIYIGQPGHKDANKPLNNPPPPTLGVVSRYHSNHSNWKFEKILNSHDEKELLKLSILEKEGMKQLN